MIRASANEVTCEINFESHQQVERAAMAFVCAVLDAAARYNKGKLLPLNRFKVNSDEDTSIIFHTVCSTKYYLRDELVTVVPVYSAGSYSIYILEDDTCDE